MNEVGLQRIAEPEAVGTLYAVLHDMEWHLAEWDGDCYCVIGTGMQCGDRWLPEWITRTVPVAEPRQDGLSR